MEAQSRLRLRQLTIRAGLKAIKLRPKKSHLSGQIKERVVTIRKLKVFFDVLFLSYFINEIIYIFLIIEMQRKKC